MSEPDPTSIRSRRWPANLRLAVVGCALAALGSAAPAATIDAAPAVSGRWEAAPPMLKARAAHAVVATGDAIVALAGTGSGGRPVLEVERFDGSGWRAETVLPGHGLNAPAAAALGRRVYVIGGFDLASNIPVDRVSVYDLDTKRWSEAAPLPAPRGGHAAAVLDGRIHVIGGGNSVSTIADHDAFDPATGRWQRLAPLPRSEGSPAAVVFGGKLYAIGGRSGASDFGDVYVYDDARDAWSAGPPIEPRGTAGAVEICGAIHLFGGESQALGKSLASVLRLDPASGRWQEQAPMPTARNFARAVRFGSAVYVVGGDPDAGNSHAGSGSAVVERYAPDCAG
ncbi:MAG: Kelch repeat-containing protein [Caldimonas sp.]